MSIKIINMLLLYYFLLWIGFAKHSNTCGRCGAVCLSVWQHQQNGSTIMWFSQHSDSRTQLLNIIWKFGRSSMQQV